VVLKGDPGRWTPREVGEWIRQRGWEEYSERFERHGIDGETLSRVTPDDLLRMLDIRSLGHRKKIVFRRNDLWAQRHS